MKQLYIFLIPLLLGICDSVFAKKDDRIEITIENINLNLELKDEVIELDWNVLAKNNSSVLSSSFIVEDQLTGKQLPYQIIMDESREPVILLIQASIAPNSSLKVVIKKGTPKAFNTKTFGRMVPERKDDFAWENDKIAFRMYGPALQATGEISNGIDVWVKSTSNLIIDKWYKLDDYHRNHGEGLDYYKVGRTLGAGGIAPYADGKLCYSKNWSGYKILNSGPLRIVFELRYEPWLINGKEITEIKRITLNAGSQLNLIEVTYQTKEQDTIPVAVGIINHPGKSIVELNEKFGYLSYIEPTNKEFGTTGVGIIVPDYQEMTLIDNHFAVLGKIPSNHSFRYYQGACWDQSKDFRNIMNWGKYLSAFSLKLQNPLKITIND